jgi:two-component system phosphate regulon sensor histidine kinase PhoR
MELPFYFITIAILILAIVIAFKTSSKTSQNLKGKGSNLKSDQKDNSEPIEKYLENSKYILDEFLDQILIINRFKEVVFLNKNAISRFGKNAKGKHLASILRAPEVLESLDKCLRTNEKQIAEVEIKNPVYQFFSSTIFPDPINKELIIIVLKDLTEIAKVQKLKSDFVANASHELRTPLQSIKLGLETINTGQKKFIPLMLEQSSRMENLIRDLLSLSKIELEEHIRPNQDIDLKTILDHVIHTQEQILQKQGIILKSNFKSDARKIIGDKDKLIEIFTNLLENAIKYSEQGKTIYVSAKKENGLINVSIKDEGAGIPKEYIPRITERFFRVDPEKSKKVGGTGLGLAIVKHLVLQHRGELNIKSEEGKGSEFIVSFPSN